MGEPATLGVDVDPTVQHAGGQSATTESIQFDGSEVEVFREDFGSVATVVGPAAECGRSRHSSCVPPQAVGDEVCAQVQVRSVLRWVGCFDGRDHCNLIGMGCSPPHSLLESISVVATCQATTWRIDSKETVGGTSGVVRKG